MIDPGSLFRFTTVVTLVTGTMFLMWLGEQITERGIGNGISLIIFAGIAAGLPRAIGGTLELARTGAFSIPLVLLLLVGAVAGDRRWWCSWSAASARSWCNYAKRQVGRKVYGGQSSHPAAQAEHVGRDPADLRLQPDPVPGHAGRLVRQQREA